jgi:hypothetical protein
MKKNKKINNIKTTFFIKKCIINNIDANTIIQKLGKSMAGYPKGLSHFIFIGPPHLNMLLKLNRTFILKV